MTPNKEDYLKIIYELGNRQLKVTNKSIAKEMHVSAPAASGMMKKLLAEQLIEKDSGMGYQLSKGGLATVSKLIRKHRLLEVFLIQNLHYALDSVHNEAEVLEHCVSDYFINQLDKMLGYPKSCPHGGKIPAEDELLVEEHRPLHLVPSGKYYVRRLSYSTELVAFLNQYGIKIGSIVEVVRHNEFAKMTTLRFNHEQYDFSDVVCSKLFVENYIEKE